VFTIALASLEEEAGPKLSLSANNRAMVREIVDFSVSAMPFSQKIHWLRGPFTHSRKRYEV
jgi:hypothetical protein